MGYVFGILAGGLIVFLLVWLAIWGRLVLTEKVLGMEGKMAGGYKKGKSHMDLEMAQGEQREPGFVDVRI